MRVGKWILGIAAGVLLLLVALVLIVTLVVDPNRFKPRIERLAQAATGQPFKIRGDLDISWYPWLALQMGAAQLGEGAPLVQWDRARVGARLFPLLRGDLVIDRVRLDGIRLRLERSAEGHGNWEQLLSARARSRTGGSSPQIGGLEIRNGYLEYRDATRDTEIALSKWTLDVGEWKSGKPFSIEAQFELRQGGQGKPAIPVDLDIPKIRLEQHPLAADVPAFELNISVAQLKGSMTLRNVKPLEAQGRVSMETESVRKLLADLGIGGPRPRNTDALAEMQMHADWVAAGGAIVVKPLEVRLDKTHFTGEMARSAAADPVWSFRLEGDRIDLDPYVTLENTDSEPFELPTAALKSLRAHGVISFVEAKLATARMKDVRMSLELQDGRLSGDREQGAP